MIQTVHKAWGKEIIFASTLDYCGKLLCFDKAGNKFSMHFHNEKDETWFVQQGKFIVITINTEDASLHEETLIVGSTWHNPRLGPHQLVALEDNSIIIEVSTADHKNDNYRVMPGDSQI